MFIHTRSWVWFSHSCLPLVLSVLNCTNLYSPKLQQGLASFFGELHTGKIDLFLSFFLVWWFNTEESSLFVWFIGFRARHWHQDNTCGCLRQTRLLTKAVHGLPWQWYWITSCPSLSICSCGHQQNHNWCLLLPLLHSCFCFFPWPMRVSLFCCLCWPVKVPVIRAAARLGILHSACSISWQTSREKEKYSGNWYSQMD